MNQSNIIFGALLLAFVVYITMRGELPTYMGFFVPGKTSGGTPSTPTTPTGNNVSSPEPQSTDPEWQATLDKFGTYMNFFGSHL